LIFFFFATQDSERGASTEPLLCDWERGPRVRMRCWSLYRWLGPRGRPILITVAPVVCALVLVQLLPLLFSVVVVGCVCEVRDFILARADV
jgi:hypothetical protein